jgi:cystathionine beta-lyase
MRRGPANSLTRTATIFLSTRPMATAASVPPLPGGKMDANIDRTGTFSRKWDGKNFGYLGRTPAVLPFWIADMDFRSPQPVIDAIVERAANGVYGYTACPPELTGLLLERLKRVGGSGIEPSAEWVHMLPGLIPGLNHAVKIACSSPTDSVIVPTPVYAPFLSAPANMRAQLADVPLKSTVRGKGEMYFEVDWPALEASIKDPATKLLHWCNPHNPTGRCWPREDLARVARLCVEHDVLLCSDEVWGEMPLEPDSAPFVSMLALLAPPGAPASSVASDPEAAGGVPGLFERLIVMTSPSKCFNVAPLDIAFAMVPDESLRARFVAAGGDKAEVSIFGYPATLAAYKDPECEAWRLRLVEYVKANRDFAADALEAMGLRCVRPEASYLMWIDATDALPAGTDAEQFFLAAGVGLNAGEPFGGTKGTCRLNFACRRETLEAGLERMSAAIAAARR